ncbi:MAG: hypothetical protein HA492_05940 [Candidatus Verstraetearchaeota archaeon]|jgi:hypothetical protein|nr:hypothetical protein [Candidatus Methanomethylicia archaeon]NHV60921.1 hypothetical protein [Candidatus Verstraetearchaeota archaeon]
MPPSEAEKLLKALFDYAKERREEGVRDFGEILSGFRNSLIDLDCNGGISKKFVKLIKDFLATDPLYQRRLTDEKAKLQGA